MHKPDPEIFRRALSRAGCKAEEAAMIGDRPDNDMLPAMEMGMCTVLVRQGKHAADDISTLPRRPDAVIHSIGEITHIF